MFFYWFLMALCSGVFLIGKIFVKQPAGELYTRENNREQKFSFIFASIVMILIIGLRHVEIGNDTYIYKYYFFDRMANEDFSYVFEEGIDERGYVFIQILFAKLGFDFVGFNVIYAIFNVSVISYLIYKWSDMPWLSYFLFFVFGFFVLNLTMMRQIIAMSIVILAVMDEDDEGTKGFLKFCLLILIAYSMHKTALIALPMWFIKRMKFSITTVITLFVLIALAYAFKAPLTEIVGNISSGISDRYENYDVEEGGSLGTLLYIMMLVTMVSSVFMSNFLADKKNQTLFLLMAGMLIIFPTTQVGGAAMRIYYYYYIFMIIYIPNMLCGMKRKKDYIMFFITLVLFLAVGISEYNTSVSGNQYNMVPYKFFWK